MDKNVFTRVLEKLEQQNELTLVLPVEVEELKELVDDAGDLAEELSDDTDGELSRNLRQISSELLKVSSMIARL